MAQRRQSGPQTSLLSRTVRWLRDEPAARLVAGGALGSALVAGTLPELLRLLPGGTVTLVLLLAGGLTALGLSWAASNSPGGLGVVVFLGLAAGDPVESARIHSFVTQQRQRYVRMFYVNGDYLAGDAGASERIPLAKRVLHARLMEEAVGKTGQVDFYLRCNLASAFDLARSAFARNADDAMPLGGLGSVRVRQFFPGTTDVDPEIVTLVSNRWGVDLAPSVQDDQVRVTPHRPIGQEGTGPSHRCALIVSLLGDHDTVASAHRAARDGDSGTGYAVKGDDRCGHEIRVEASLKSEEVSHQAIVAAVIAEWRRFQDSLPEAGSVEGRLFIRGPVAIAFALGALLPKSVTLVPYAS